MQARNAAPKTNPSTSIRRPCRSDGLGDGDGRQYEGHDAEAQVEPEDGAPAGEPDQKAADDGTEGQSQARDRGPHPERVGTGLPVGVHVPDDRQRAGLAGRGADPHDHATGDEPVDVSGQRGDDGATAEDGDADEHDALAAEDVAEHAGHQHETGERQRIAVDHPLQRGDAGMQVALDVGQADADHRVVQEGEEEDSAERGQREGLGRRAEAALLDVESGAEPPRLPLRRPLPASTRTASSRQSGIAGPALGVSWARVLPTQAAGSGTLNGVPSGSGGGSRRSRGAPSDVSVDSVRLGLEAWRTGGGFRYGRSGPPPVTEGNEDLAPSST